MAEQTTLPSLVDLEGRESKQRKQLNRGIKRLQRNIRSASSLEKAFNKAAKKRAPLRRQIAAAGRAFEGIENPGVRRQLIREATTAIRGRRQQGLAQAEQALQNRLSAQQFGIQARQARLSDLIADRRQAQSLAAQQAQSALDFERQKEFDALQRQRALEDMQKQREEGLEFFGSRGSGGGGGSNLQFKATGGGGFGIFDPNTGQFVQLQGSAPEPVSVIPTVEESFAQLEEQAGQSLPRTAENIAAARQAVIDAEAARSAAIRPQEDQSSITTPEGFVLNF